MKTAAPEASGSFELVASANGRFVARGPLTFATARQARQRGLHCLASAAARELEVDCGGVTASDSAGLAVLLDWLGAMKRSEEHTSELQSLAYLVCRLLLEKKKSHPSHVRIVKL